MKVARWVGWLAGAFVLGLILTAVAGGARVLVPAFVAWMDGLGRAAPVIFVAVFALSNVAFVPASILTVAAGVLFGVTWGTVYAFLGALLSAAISFVLARYVARATIARRMGRDRRFIRIDRAIARKGFRMVFLLRLSPVLPFAIVNYSLGLTRVGAIDYLAGTLGVLPPTWLYVYNGKLFGDVVEVGVDELAAGGPGNYLVLLAGLAATVIVTVWLARVTQRAFR